MPNSRPAPVRSLTQQEAKNRAELIEVDRYDITVDLTGLPSGPDVTCESVITFGCRTPGSSTFVDCAADVRSATLNGRPLPPPQHGRIPLDELARTNELRVRSVQSNTTRGNGVHKAVDPADGEIYVWTTFEPDDARYAWACFDQPDLKAPHAITVLAPEAWTVLSNSGDPEVTDSDGARLWRFPDTPRLSTYNIVVDAGPFHGIRRQADGHDLGLYARRSLAAVLERDADEIFTVTQQGLDFFGRTFSMPFPQRKYDQVFMPEYAGAMENYGCVTWSDAFLRRVPPTPAEQQLLAVILLHEMAHMWFGNIVTMRWWDDLWLNEAFADFACNWAAERNTRHDSAWSGYLVTQKITAYLADQGPGSHPIRQRISDVAAAAANFDAITYPKGASVLKQLMAYLGEDNFAAGMARYFARHAWGNTTLPDLLRALEEASGRDLAPWAASWLEVAGTDTFGLERSDGRWTLVGRGPGGPPRHQVVALGAYAREGDGLRRVDLVTVEVAQRETAVELPEADLHLINDDDLTFATAQPRSEARSGLIDQAALLPDVTGRAVAVATVWNLLTTGQASAAEAVHCLTRVLGTETDEAVIEPYLTLACDAADLWAPEARRVELCAAVAATCRDVARVEHRRTVALRALARVCADLDDLGRLRTDAGDDIDLQWRVLVRKAELGGEVEGDCRELRDRDRDPDAWVREVTVRAAIPTAEAKHAAWRSMAVDRGVPMAQMSTVGRAFWRPGCDALLAPFVRHYRAMLAAFGDGGMLPGMVLTRALFPIFAVTESDIDDLVAAAGGTNPVVGKTLLERADEVRRMLRARSLSGTAG